MNNDGNQFLIFRKGFNLLTTERSERAQSSLCSIEISHTYEYIYIYVAIHQVICACSVVHNVGGLSVNHLLKHSNHLK